MSVVLAWLLRHKKDNGHGYHRRAQQQVVYRSEHAGTRGLSVCPLRGLRVYHPRDVAGVAVVAPVLQAAVWYAVLATVALVVLVVLVVLVAFRVQVVQTDCWDWQGSVGLHWPGVPGIPGSSAVMVCGEPGAMPTLFVPGYSAG
jgi:hypothetical protein